MNKNYSFQIPIDNPFFFSCVGGENEVKPREISDDQASSFPGKDPASIFKYQCKSHAFHLILSKMTLNDNRYHIKSLEISHSLQGTWRRCFRRPITSSTPGKPVGWWGKPEIVICWRKDKEGTRRKRWTNCQCKAYQTAVTVNTEHTAWRDMVNMCWWWGYTVDGCCYIPKCTTETNCISVKINCT